MSSAAPTPQAAWLAPREAQVSPHDDGKDSDVGNARHRGESLRGVSWVGRDLQGADLSECDLREAQLMGANLSGAILHGACLDDADLTGADLSGAFLEEASLQRVGLGKAKLQGVTAFQADFSQSCMIEADLADADMRRANLDGVRLNGATLGYADFAQASMMSADLSGARVDRASFVEADLRRARLRQLRRFERACFVRADVRDVDFSGAYLLRRHIIDQNYLAEFRQRSPFNAVVYWLWRLTSDCGRSALRWAALTAAITVAFGFAYPLVDIDYGEHSSWLSPFYFSVVTVTTLGYGDVLPASTPAQAMVITQVCIGYLMLGGLISLFATKMGRRGE